ncbi:MAG: hypothetical protein JHD16_08370 [Solirubrobacteraceae bacterium]|nr:hypothetical protein [Solirubrobacteraceae bacterium]
MKRLIGISLIAATAAFAAGCGESPEDQARDAGEQVGEDLRTMRTATSSEEAGRAIDSVAKEIEGIREDLPARLADELATIQEDTRAELAKATDAAGRRSVYLDAASQINALASDTNSVINEFRRGVREGLTDQ